MLVAAQREGLLAQFAVQLGLQRIALTERGQPGAGVGVQQGVAGSRGQAVGVALGACQHGLDTRRSRQRGRQKLAQFGQRAGKVGVGMKHALGEIHG